MLVNRRTLRIEWGQCDPAGIVFYPQYLLIFDTSTGWLFERTGLKPLAMRRKYGIVGMPIVEVGARFVMPCRFDDEVVVESDGSPWKLALSLSISSNIKTGFFVPALRIPWIIFPGSAPT